VVQSGVPTLLDEGGIRVVVNTQDHEPPHVHCLVGGHAVIVLLEPEVRVRGRSRLPAADERRVLALVRAHRGYLTKAFRRLHP
jgi:Domain of unknown function (DUF4160)